MEDRIRMAKVKITETVLFGQAVPGDCFKIVYILLRILLRFAGLASRFPLLLALHALSHAPNRNRHIIQKSSPFFYVSASCTNLLYRWKFFPFLLLFLPNLALFGILRQGTCNSEESMLYYSHRPVALFRRRSSITERTSFL